MTDSISMQLQLATEQVSQSVYTNALKSGNVATDSNFSQMLAAQMMSQTLTGGDSSTGIGGDTLVSGGFGGSGMDGLSMMMMLGDEASVKDGIVLLCQMMAMGMTSYSSMSSVVPMLVSAMQQMPEATIGDLRNFLLTGSFDYTAKEQANSLLFGEEDANYPFSASKVVTPQVTSDEENRSAETYRAVIDQFSVTTNPRYMVNKKGQDDTYCNIFLWDVTLAMGAEIPHYVDSATGQARAYPDVQGARELTANATYDWLAQHGEAYGWRRATAEEAQQMANEGKPAITIWKNPGGHGHAQIVCPSEDGVYDPERGVTVAQAGSKLHDYVPITQIYSDRSLETVAYYVHE